LPLRLRRLLFFEACPLRRWLRCLAPRPALFSASAFPPSQDSSPQRATSPFRARWRKWSEVSCNAFSPPFHAYDAHGSRKKHLAEFFKRNFHQPRIERRSFSQCPGFFLHTFFSPDCVFSPFSGRRPTGPGDRSPSPRFWRNFQISLPFPAPIL